MFAVDYFGNHFWTGHYFPHAGRAPEPHVIDAFGIYRPTLDAFGRHEATLDGFGRFESVLTTFGNEGEV